MKFLRPDFFDLTIEDDTILDRQFELYREYLRNRALDLPLPIYILAMVLQMHDACISNLVWKKIEKTVQVEGGGYSPIGGSYFSFDLMFLGAENFDLAQWKLLKSRSAAAIFQVELEILANDSYAYHILFVQSINCKRVLTERTLYFSSLKIAVGVSKKLIKARPTRITLA